MPSSSCNVPKPIVDWGTGSAPTLKYNLPQGTTLTPVARIPLNIPTTKFKPAVSSAPENNFWSQIENMSVDNITRDMLTNLLQNANQSKFINNVKSFTLTASKKVSKFGGTSGSTATVSVKATKFGGTSKVNNVKLNSVEGTEMTTLNLGGTEMSSDYIVNALKAGLMPVAEKTIAGESKIRFVKKPVVAIPRIYILEEYRINSYLGDYGAGKIVKTFTLLPGEKTTITMRTFKQMTSKQATSQNVLESVSSEVVDSLDSFVQDERQNSSSSSSSSSESFNLDVSVGCDLGFVSASVDVGYETSSSADQSRTDAVNSLSNAMDKHTAQSNTNREVNINNSTEDSSTEEHEETIVRNLENINYSRVLNFVFRQMQQEYICVTTLNNIKILFTNGYPESVRLVGVEKLKELLEEVILPTDVDSVYADIINQYCSVRNYNEDLVPFLTHVTYPKSACVGSGINNIDYWTTNGATDSFEFLGAIMNVPGIILEIKKRTLQTDSVICDALLGQMDALDCYNMKRQEADASKAETESQLMKTINELFATATATEKIELAKIAGRLLTNCCDTPQSGGCGCGDTTSSRELPSGEDTRG